MTELQDLWQAILAYSPGYVDASLGFARRLAEENGWTEEYAQRVVMEYKRFVFLAATREHPVTPSDQVDQAWHLHLTYSRDYWEEFCPGTLGRPLHHDPTRGGSAERAKYFDWYERTLNDYRTVFGEPPADIWPASAIRFAQRFERRLIVEHKARPSGRWAALVAALGLAGSAWGAQGNAGFNWIWFLLLIGGFLLFLVWLLRRSGTAQGKGRNDGSGCGGAGCGSVGGSSHDGGDSGCSGGSGCGGGGCGGGCGG